MKSDEMKSLLYSLLLCFFSEEMITGAKTYRMAFFPSEWKKEKVVPNHKKNDNVWKTTTLPRYYQLVRSLIVSDLRTETKGSRFESGC